MTNILISFNSLPRIVHVWIDLFHWKYNQNFPIASTVYIYILLQGFVLEKPSHDILHQKYFMISYVMFTITFWVIHTDCSAPGGKQSWKRHIPLEKWPPFWQTTFSNQFSRIKMMKFRLKFHWNLFPIDIKSALVRVMAWHLPGHKPLPEPMLTKFTDAYMRH